jgi:hypothetical protein
MTTSHLTNPAKDAGQVIGYSHIPLMKLLAIPLGCQRTTTKWLVISRQKMATKWLVMLRCVKNFLLAYPPYAARQNEVSV